MPKTVHIRAFTATKDPNCSSLAEDPECWPTYDNVVSSFKQTTSSARAGDFVYIHFSGHGTSLEPLKDPLNPHMGGTTLVPSNFSKPSTGDLALVLLDATTGTGIRYLRGEELASLIKAMVGKGLLVTLVLDCCFSGSVMRHDSSVRYLKYDPKVDVAYPPAPKLSSNDDGAGRSVCRSASMRLNWLVNPDGYTILTACGPTEKAKELNFGNEQKRGALSYLLLRALETLGQVGARYWYIYPYLRARFREAQEQRPHEQIPNPMLYGNKNLCFFGRMTPGVASAPIPVIRKVDHSLQLEAGQAHGICDGDRFSVYPLSSAEQDFVSGGDPVIAMVTHTRALSSDLEILDATAVRLGTGMIATALTNLALQRFPVRLELGLPYPDEWAKSLQDRPSLDVYDVDHAKPGRPFSFYIRMVGDVQFELRDESNQRVPNLPTSLHDPSHVLDMVEHLVRFKLVRSLANQSLADPAHPFRNSFSVQLVNSAKHVFYPGCSHKCSHSECLIEAESGDELELVIENKEKKDGNALHLHIYNMGPCWEIENVLEGNHEVIPPRYSNRHLEFSQGTTGIWKQKLEMSVPSEVKDKDQVQYEDIIKVFLTVQSTSFLSLELPELGKCAARHQTSRTRGEGEGHSSENWAALNFRIRTIFKSLIVNS